MSELNVFTRPNFSAIEAEEILQQQYGIYAKTRPLPSYDDQNFHVIAENGRQYVLKISSQNDSRDNLLLQNRAMAHLEATIGDVCMQPVPTRDQQFISTAIQNDHIYLMRLMTWVHGTPYGKMNTLPANFHDNLGRFVAKMDCALEDFTHPASTYASVWNLTQADGIHPFLSDIDDDDRRAMIIRFLDAYERDVQPVLINLRQQIIHGDVNEYNTLCDGESIVGIVDFGDTIHTALVCEPAITAAYAALNQPNPWETAVAVLSGYHHVNPLSEQEIELLFNLVAMRLCTSVTMSSYSAKLEPENTYIPISAKPAWRVLAAFDALDYRVALKMLRNGLGVNLTPKHSIWKR